MSSKRPSFITHKQSRAWPGRAVFFCVRRLDDELAVHLKQLAIDRDAPAAP
jgi:hypothetical protein